MGSNHQFQNQMPEEFVHQLSSTISCQDNYLSQNGGSSMWGSSFNVPNPVAQMPLQNGLPVSGNLDIHQQSYTTNTGPKVEESSLMTDAKSSLARVSYFPSNGNGNGSTKSLASNYARVSGTPTGNHFSAQQHIIQAGQACSQWFGGQDDQLSNDLSPQLMIPAHQAPVRPLMNKRPRLEIQPDDPLLGYTLQQLSPNQVPVQLHQQILPNQIPMQLHQQPSPIQVPMQLQTCDPVVASRIFQQKSIQNQQQNQIPLLVPSSQGHLQQRLPPQQMPEDAQKEVAAYVAIKGNICARQLMQYMCSQRQRPPDNNIDYWREFVDAYYSPTAKRRWCFSKNRYRVCQDYRIASWKCDLCGSNSGKRFESCYEALPRLKHIYFNSGVVDELLYVDSPAERRLPSGFMVLSYGRAVQESVYKHSRVIHEGQLRIVFTEKLKIISWEFCIQFHEEFVSRRLVAAQVNQLVEDAAKCQSSSQPKETEGAPAQNLLSKCNRVVAAGLNLATNLESPLANEFGFPKQFVRCMQMFAVVCSMTDLMAYNQTNNCGPIETLKRYHEQAANAKLKKHTEYQGQMQQQTPYADRSICQAARFMTQTPNAREQQAVFDPQNYHQNSMMEEHRNEPSTSSMPNQRLSSPANGLLGPSSSLKDPIIANQINGLLALMHAARTSGNCGNNARGKDKLAYDTTEDVLPMVPAEQTKEANTLYTLGGMSDKGKGYNYSSSNNSSARNFADNCMVKREPVSDDDSNSPGCYQPTNELRDSNHHLWN